MNKHFKSADLVPGPPVHTDFAATMPDGSMIVTAEQLARFGNGDPAEGRKELRRMIAEAANGHAIQHGPTEKPASVRVATMADEPALVELMLLDLKENAERVATINKDRVLSHIQACTRTPGPTCGVIDGPDGTPVAVVMLFNLQWWFSNQWYYLEIMNYVHPDHRKSRHAADLLQYMRWWSDEMSRNFGYRTYLLCGVLTARRMFAKIMLYKRRFTQVGSSFLYPSPELRE